jgi:Uma2 family endonuclease
MEITDINQLDFSKTYSFADYLTWKFEEMVELIRGKVARMAVPLWQHQVVTGNIYRELSTFLEEKPCIALIAPIDVRIPKVPTDTDDKVFTVVQPDVCVLCDDKKQYNHIHGWVGIPDLVVEIVSPSTRKRDLKDKKDIYEEAGVREYWVVFPNEKMVFQFVLDNQKYRDYLIWGDSDVFESAIFPDFSLDLKKAFKNLDKWT